MTDHIVNVKWSRPMPISAGAAKGGGIYLWCFRKYVVYIGETVDFQKRLIQHVANTIGYGGSAYDLINMDDPYSLMSCSCSVNTDTKPTCNCVNKAVSDGKFIQPWTMTDDSKTEFFQNFDPESEYDTIEEKFIKRVRPVLRFLHTAKILYGYIDDEAIDRKEIEGGILDRFRTNKHIMHYGTKSNNTLLGRISKYPRKRYRLISDEHSDTEGVKLARRLFTDVLYYKSAEENGVSISLDN